jgi:hypothetical protein
MLARAPRLGPGTSTPLLSSSAACRSGCGSHLSSQAPHRYYYNQRKARHTGLFPQVPKSQQMKRASWFQAPCNQTCWVLLLIFWLGSFCLLCSCRCTLETAGPGFDPLGLYEEGSNSLSRSPLSTFFGIMAPVFGSSSGGGASREKASGRGAAGCQFRAISFSLLSGLILRNDFGGFCNNAVLSH